MNPAATGRPRSPRMSALCAILGLLSLVAQTEAAFPGVSPGIAFVDAQRIVEQNPAWSIFRGEGSSMAPRFDANHLLIVDQSTGGTIKPGMIVLFRDTAGDLVAHTVTACDEAAITTRGLNNGHSDPGRITTDAIIGVLVGTLAANQPIPESYGLPTALGKTY